MEEVFEPRADVRFEAHTFEDQRLNPDFTAVERLGIGPLDRFAGVHESELRVGRSKINRLEYRVEQNRFRLKESCDPRSDITGNTTHAGRERPQLAPFEYRMRWKMTYVRFWIALR